MSDHVYKVITVVGSSTEGIEDAIQNAITTCGESVHHMRWFETDEIRGHIAEGNVAHYQVKLNIGFTVSKSVEDASEG